VSGLAYLRGEDNMGLEVEEREVCHCDLCERLMSDDYKYRRCCLCDKYICSGCSESSPYDEVIGYTYLCSGCAKTHSFCMKVTNKKTGKVVKHTEWD